MARPVCVVASGGSPFVSVSDGPPATPVADGPPITLVEAGAPPICLVNDDGSAWFENVADADYGWDFIANQAIWNSASIGALANTPNWTFTRASTGYAQTSGGVLQSFASGELRRTDKGVLIEGAGTNLCLQSQTFDNASWTKTNGAISANAIAAPDGTMTADLFTVTSTTFTSLYQTVGAVSGTTCTATVYVQAANIVSATSSFILYDVTAGANIVSGTLTWNTMTIAGTGASIKRLESTNWYRVTLTTAAWTSGNSARVYFSASGGTMTVASSWYIWGAQLEATAYASSYIPTTTASATRAADSLTVTGVTGLDYPLSLYAEFDFGSNDSTVLTNQRSAFSVGTNGSNNERNGIYNVSGSVGGLSQAGGVTQAAPLVGATVAADTTVKVAYRAALNNFIAAKNGTLSAADTSGSVSSTPNVIAFGAWPLGSFLYGYLRRAAIYSRALSDAELQALTT